MDEGKPTKAKWWGRPRVQEPAGEPEDSTPQQATDRHDTGRPADTAGPAPAGTDGDFELARPAARHAAEAQADRVASGDRTGRGDGDYELRSPEVPVPAVADTSASADGEAGEADRSCAPAEDDTLHGGSTPAAASVPSPSPSVPASPFVPAGSGPQPLHDPDPYSTPPYGEPGPWAPAPPVQHPATAAGQALAAPVHPAAPGAPVPASHAAPPMTPPSGPAAVAPGEPPLPPAGAPAHPGAPLPTQAQPTAQVPTQAQPTAQDPTQTPPSTQAAAQAPSAAAPVPAQAPPPGGPAAAPPPDAAHGEGGAAPAAPETAPDTALDPWQRYDPWAVPGGSQGPLQQTGAAVLSTAQRRRKGRKSLVAAGLVIALVSGGIGGAVGTYLERNGGVGAVELPQAGKEPAGRDAESVAGIAGRALPSVVTLHVSGSGEQGTGTGFVLDTRGHILTNNHVVQPAGSGGDITVTFDGGQTARAEVVGRDSGYDLAVVKVKGVRGLTPLPLGNSDNVRVGDPVVAIGAPFDLAGTVTSGIISAKQRPITAGGEKGDGSDVSYVDALQTDAPINPGNSGGPLLDARARVIGINSAIRSAESGSGPDSGQSGSIGLGFAIPINQGKRVAEELINTGRATHPVIGITLDMDYSGDGARVAAEGGEGGPPVTKGGPGAEAGIKAGDVITEVDGQRVHSGEELIVKTRAHRPGDRLELTLERNGRERTVSLVLGSSGG
ncbi:trypsin-like peptidase domain-containing protein [Streptomyces sp. NPDC001046]|uniref:trypsin-like peptidase domain-containing protein n=1 Tax=Streptomyces sp. NPDC001046 TaxID=3364543 RepID=UPI00369DA971